MIRKTRNENFSREEKEFIVRYVNENLKILENKSNTSEVYLKKRDKWRDLTEKLKAYGVVRDWKEVRHAYQRWKWYAKKNITAFQKWGDSVPASMSPTDFDYLIYNVCSQDFKDDESNFSNDSENNLVMNEYDDLSNMSHSFVTTNSESYVSYPLQFTEKSTEYTNEILDNLKIKLEPQPDEDLPNTYEETRINTHCVQNTNIPANSTNAANVSGKSSTDVIDIVHKEQKHSPNNDQMSDNGIYNVDNNIEFKRQENILKLKILRVQLNREEEVSKIKLQQEKIKLNILKLQLKRERILLRNVQRS